MSAVHVVALVLYGAGVLVAVLAAVGALLVPGVLERLHLVTPITAVATPLVCLGVAVQSGWTLATGAVLLTGLVVAATGAVVATETGRLAGKAEGFAEERAPR